MGNVTTIADLKAVGQNLMYTSLGITDRLWRAAGRWCAFAYRVAGRWCHNGPVESASGDKAEIAAHLQALFAQLET